VTATHCSTPLPHAVGKKGGLKGDKYAQNTSMFMSDTGGGLYGLFLDSCYVQILNEHPS